MTVRLIGLCSPAMGSGKTTCADMLVRSHQFVRVAFATPLKSMATALLTSGGMSPDQARDHIYGDRKEDHIELLGMTARRLQQLLGTEFARHHIRDTIWVDIAIAHAKTLMTAGYSVVIDDMRFPNEYDAIIAAGGDCIRVVRPDATVTSAHASEGQLDGVHMPEIWNTGSLFDLHQATLQRVFA